MASFLVYSPCLWLLLHPGGFLRAVDAPRQHPSVLMGVKSREHDVVELRKGSRRISRFDGELHNEPPYENRLYFDPMRSFSLTCPTVEDSGRYTYSTFSNSSGDEIFSRNHTLHVFGPGRENQTVFLGELVHFNESCMFAKLFMSLDGTNFQWIASYHELQLFIRPNVNVTFNVSMGFFAVSHLTLANSVVFRTEIFESINSKLRLISNITEHLQVVAASDESCIPGDRKTSDGTHQNNHKEDGQTSYPSWVPVVGAVVVVVAVALILLVLLVSGWLKKHWVLQKVTNLRKIISGFYNRVVGSPAQHRREETELEMNALNGELETVTASTGSLPEAMRLLDSGPSTNDAVVV